MNSSWQWNLSVSWICFSRYKQEILTSSCFWSERVAKVAKVNSGWVSDPASWCMMTHWIHCRIVLTVVPLSADYLHLQLTRVLGWWWARPSLGALGHTLLCLIWSLTHPINPCCTLSWLNHRTGSKSLCLLIRSRMRTSSSAVSSSSVGLLWKWDGVDIKFISSDTCPRSIELIYIGDGVDIKIISPTSPHNDYGTISPTDASSTVRKIGNI